MTKLEELVSALMTGDCYSPIGDSEQDIKDVMKEYAKFCCEEQKKICAKNVVLIDNYRQDHESVILKFDNQCDYYINESSILNAPTYKEEDGK